MTARSISAAARRAMGDAGRRAKASGFLGMPGTTRGRRHPTWRLHRVAQIQGERRLDQYEAAETFAHLWWAKQAVYLGYSRGWFTFEVPPEEEKPR